MKRQHTNLYEAILIYKDLESKQLIGVHWGTFKMTNEDMWTPVKDLEAARIELEISAKDFRVLKHGETIEL